MKKIVVIGGGTMGLDIATVFARTGHTVVVREISQEFADKAKARLEASLAKLVSKGKMDEEKKASILSNMTFTTDIALAADADLVIEAAVEKLEVKQSIFAELDAICKPETILATNTSSISITAIASATKRPDKFIGMHFFNPATVMKLVEVIRGVHTSQETFEAIFQLSKDIGKDIMQSLKTLVGGELEGYTQMMNEARAVATRRMVDAAIERGAEAVVGIRYTSSAVMQGAAEVIAYGTAVKFKV